MAYIYELSSEAGAVCALRAPSGLACVAMDAGEKRLLLGGTLGEVFLVDMDVVSQARTASRALVHAVSGGGPASGRQAGSNSQESERWDVLAGHSKAVRALACAWDGRVLVSASDDGSLRWWDLDNQQCVKKVVFDTPGPLAHLLLLPRPAALLEMLPKAIVPAPLQPFKKYRTGATAGAPGGDTVFVPGGRGGKQWARPPASLLFFWGAQDASAPPAPSSASSKGDVEPLVEEAVEEGETKKRRLPTPTATAAAAPKGKKGGGRQRKK